MENYSIGALVVVFLVTLFFELHLFKFEMFHTTILDEKQLWWWFISNVKGWYFLLNFTPTLKTLLSISALAPLNVV